VAVYRWGSENIRLATPGGFHDNQLYRLPDVFLQFEVEALEFPREEWQGNVAFVGPLLPQSRGLDPIAAWLKARDRKKPLVFVSQGTVANRDLGHRGISHLPMKNSSLNAAVANGTFRQDLLYRLNVFPIEVPPLRERKDDILMLVEYFVQRYANRAARNIRLIDQKTLDPLQSYDWPGNIRELQNILKDP
jgi:sigma54-dependent transcription regulator